MFNLNQQNVVGVVNTRGKRGGSRTEILIKNIQVGLG
jgi:hypothetical protein